MRFQSKVFFAIFLSAAVLLGTTTLLMHAQFKAGLERRYFEQYDSFTQIVGDTLKHMEEASTILSVNSAKYLHEIERTSGLPSESFLAELKKSLRVSQFCVADSQGRILRDTETPVSQRTYTMFDFCDGYRGLLSGELPIETTPILPSYPTGQAYKFTMIPNHNRTRILESGIRLDFIQEILRKALESDKNIVSIGLFSPRGITLGYTSSSGGATKPGDLSTLDLTPGKIVSNDKALAFVKRVAASTETCCECIKKNLTGPDGKYYYLLRAEIALEPLLQSVLSLRIKLGLLFLGSVLVAFILARWLSKRLVARIQQIQEGVGNVMESGDLSLRLDYSGSDEVAELGRRFNQMISRLEVNQKNMIEAERARTLAELARQVAHDIRSPLAAFDVVLRDLSELPEETRILVKSAVTRIREIANDLLFRSRSMNRGESDKEEPPHSCLISGLIDQVVREKQTQFRDRLGVKISYDFDPDAYRVIASVQVSEFKRVLSNLINNAVEAIRDQGQVKVSLRGGSSKIQILVEDNGAGIPPEILSKLKLRGQSFGKASGSGLGLFHADQAVQRWNGSLAIESEVEEGTKATITLPNASLPSWFVSEIKIPSRGRVVVLDDDPSIHEIWRHRFELIKRNGLSVELLHFHTSVAIEEWLIDNSPLIADSLFLFDYELRGEMITGLNIIERHRINDRAILVTSSYEERVIMSECERLGVRLIPKSLAALVPISIETEAAYVGTGK